MSSADLLILIALFVISLLIIRWLFIKVRLGVFGKEVDAIVTNVYDEVIEAKWTRPETNKPYVFSGSIPGRYRYQQGDVIHVTIDPENPKHYKMKPQLRKILG